MRVLHGAQFLFGKHKRAKPPLLARLNLTARRIKAQVLTRNDVCASNSLDVFKRQSRRKRDARASRASGDFTNCEKIFARQRIMRFDMRGATIGKQKFSSLSARLGDAEWLDGGFSAGDLMMVEVLKRIKMSGLLDEYPNLAAYVARGEARPAYQRAFAAQLAINAPPTG